LKVEIQQQGKAQLRVAKPTEYKTRQFHIESFKDKANL
jgi:hypothetical protein